MPNSLVHFAIQGAVSKSVFRVADMKWVFLGCIIPDIPWIIQRLTHVVLPQVDPYSLRLYVIVQASLVFCLLLSAFFALLSEKPKMVFLILALNSFVHLLLDALEIKLGSGVHLFAPLTWELLTIGLVWPEHYMVTLMTAIGLGYITYFLLVRTNNPVRVSLLARKNVLPSIVFLIFYFVMPLALVDGPEKYNNHYVSTLQENDKRAGKEILLDRAFFIPRADGGDVRTFAGEELKLIGGLPDQSGAVSIRGVFEDKSTIKVLALHENHGLFRDMASYTALLLFALLWVLSVFKPAILRNEQVND